MSPEPLTCPFCNAFIPASESTTAGQRATCPRCGEVFALRQPMPGASADVQTAAATASPLVGVDLDVDRRLRMRRNNRRIAAGVLAVMGLGAILSLAYALYSQPERRANDFRMPHKPRGPNLTEPSMAPGPTPPAAQAGLRWLPLDCNVIAGVQVAEMRQSDAGRLLLDNLSHIGKIEINADRLEKWMGLTIEEIDQVVLGVKLTDELPPRTVLVVRTLQPYNADALRTALHSERLPDANGKTLYKCKAFDGGLAPVLWFADERTLVFALLAKHLEPIPDKPAAGLERLSPEMRTLLENRLQSAGPAWVVGYAADWRKTIAAVVAPAKDADFLDHTHGFTIQLLAEQQTTLLASLQCDNADAAQAMQKRLLALKPAPDADWKVAREGSWLTLQLRGDPAAIFKEMWK